MRGSEGEEGKGKGSVVSRGTEWPTQSGVGREVGREMRREMGRWGSAGAGIF